MNQQKRGIFIVFEGIDGSGKSTQIKMLTDSLHKKGYPVFSTFEPSDGPIGSLIRKMLSGEVETDQRTIAMLFAADRTDHLLNRKNGIKNKVNQKIIVLCDRYYFSSYAYHAQHIPMDWVIQLNQLNEDILRPDMTVFIDVDPKTCFERIEKARSSLEIYEKIDVMKEVRDHYFTAFKKLKTKEKVVVVDGNTTTQNVAQSIWDHVRQLVENNE
ncbi:MAG: dTMP kinase [Desulfobacteraceae bacterium]|nr:dTMP kinase [Desulfobacteraceae bacterium]